MLESYEISEAKAKLIDEDGNPTPQYQAYMRYQEDYQNKRKAYETAYADAVTNPLKLHLWGMQGKSYIDEIDGAMDRWTALGYKNEIESALGLLAAQNIKLDITDTVGKEPGENY